MVAGQHQIRGVHQCISIEIKTIAGPGFYEQEGDTIQAKLAELADSEALLEQRIERWSELESLAESLQSG